MVDATTILVATLRDEFQELSVRLRKEFKEELLKFVNSNPTLPAQVNLSRQDTTSLPPQINLSRIDSTCSTVIGPSACMDEDDKLRDAALEIAPWRQQLESMKPMISSLTGECDTWNSMKPMRSVANTERIRRMVKPLQYLEGSTRQSADGESNVFETSTMRQNSPTELPAVKRNQYVANDGETHLQDLPGQVEQLGNPMGIGKPEAFKNDHRANEVDAQDVAKREERGKKKRQTSAQKALGIVNKLSMEHELAHHVGECEPSNTLRIKAINIVMHWSFEPVSVMIIALNAIGIGITTDHMAKERQEDEPVVAIVVETVVCVIFTGEVFLKLVAWHWHFFTMYGWAWNVFDLVVVCTQIAEVIAQLFLAEDVVHEGSILRTLRYLRLLRVIRLLRMMKFTEELQLLISCILHSCKGFVWALALILLLVYTASIYLCQLSTSTIMDGRVSSAEQGQLENLYGSIPVSVLSILEGFLGGKDWGELVDPVRNYMKFGALLAVAFVLFILFAILVVLNVVTGLFVQTALEGAQEIKELHRFNQAREMFTALDMDASGEITLNEISSHLEDTVVQDFFEEMDVDSSEAQSLFKLIDIDISGVIDCEEFLLGCMRLQGPAKATDLLMVTNDLRAAFERQWQALEALEKQLCSIGSAMHSFLSAKQER